MNNLIDSFKELAKKNVSVGFDPFYFEKHKTFADMSEDEVKKTNFGQNSARLAKFTDEMLNMSDDDFSSLRCGYAYLHRLYRRETEDVILDMRLMKSYIDMFLTVRENPFWLDMIDELGKTIMFDKKALIDANHREQTINNYDTHMCELLHKCIKLGRTKLTDESGKEVFH